MKKIPPVIVVGVSLTALCLIMFYLRPRMIVELSNKAYDAILTTTYDFPKSHSVALVDIDEASLREKGQWPWPRYKVADLARRILEAGAEVVAFDIVFPESDRTSPSVLEQDVNGHFNLSVRLEGMPDELRDYDALLAGELKKGKTVLGCQMHQADKPIAADSAASDPYYKAHFMLHGKGRGAEKIMQADSVTVSIPLLSQASTKGFFNAVTDSDNIVRSNPLVWAVGTGRIYPALALEAMRLYMGEEKGVIEYDDLGVVCIRLGETVIPTDEAGRIWINYRAIRDDPSGFESSFPVYSAADLLAGRVGKRALAGKIVFVGTSAVGLKDVKATPLTQHLSGVEVHATMADNILAGDVLRHPNWMMGANFLAIAITGLFLTVCIHRGRSWFSLLVTVAVILLSIKFSIFLMGRHQCVFIPAWLVVTAAVIHPVLTTMKYWQEELQRKRVREMFGTMVSEDVLRYMEANPESFSLCGTKAEVSVMFSDLARFTTISESLPPEKLSQLMNRYLSEMTKLVLDRRGLVDKYEGDLIMAEWGVPFPLQDHALQSCLAALDQQERLSKMRPDLKELFGQDIYARIGINTGIVTAGNMGSEKRMQYTVIGDAVNEAARLEPANKIYGTSIIIGEATDRIVKDELETRLLDKIVVRGKTVPTRVYELLGRKGETPPARVKLARIYEAALELHWNRKWDDALDMLKSALDIDHADGPCGVLIARITAYRANPPPASWDGEFAMTP